MAAGLSGVDDLRVKAGLDLVRNRNVFVLLLLKGSMSKLK